MSADVYKDYKEIKEKAVKFTDIYDNINILINYLYALYTKGYPNLIKETITIKNSEAYDGEKNNNKKTIEKYKNLANNLEEAQTLAYKECPFTDL